MEDLIQKKVQMVTSAYQKKQHHNVLKVPLILYQEI